MKKLIIILLSFITVTIFTLACSKDEKKELETRCYRCDWDIKGVIQQPKAGCKTYHEFVADKEAIVKAQRAAGSSVYYKCTGQGDW